MVKAPGITSLVTACLQFIKDIISEVTPLPFIPASQREPIQLQHPNLGNTEIACDGSHDPSSSTSGVGTATLYQTWHSNIPGKQCIDRAEAFALALAIKLAHKDQPCTIFCDSQATLKAVESIVAHDHVYTHRKPPVPNLSIMLYIKYLLQQRPNVKLEWIKAHTNNTNLASNLNEKADQAAKQGRMSSTHGLKITESYMFLPDYYPITTNKEIVEGKYYNTYYNKIDYNRLTLSIQKEITRRNAGLQHKSSICNLMHPGIWLQAAHIPFKNNDPDHDLLMLFKNKLSTSSLPTPFIKGKWTPGLYDTSACEICNVHSKPDEFHYICTCDDYVIQQARMDAISWLHQTVQEQTHNLHLDKLRLYNVVFPTDKATFTHGLVPTTLLDLLMESHPSQDALKILSSHAQLWWTKTMHMVWTVACKVLKDMGLDYATRSAWMRQQTEI